MDTDKAAVLEKIADTILKKDMSGAKQIINEEYGFVQITHNKRSYSLEQKMKRFLKDGFIDRYSGKRLVNPGMLKVLSKYFPDDFPYHPHGETTKTHKAYWELFPTIDHVVPIAKGGIDDESNWVTTSMLSNSVKSNWSLEQLHWKLYSSEDRTDLTDWDGLTAKFIEIVENDKQNLLEDDYIKRWYQASIKSYNKDYS